MNEPRSTRDLIVVIGERNINKLNVFNTALKACGQQLLQIQKENEPTFYPWQLDTKYYSAPVKFCFLDADFVDEGFFDSLTTKEKRAESTTKETTLLRVGQHCEAVVLVFDSQREETFSSLRKWKHFVTAFSPSVGLLVGLNFNDDESVMEEERKSFFEWSLECELEFVHVTEPILNSFDSLEPVSSNKHKSLEDAQDKEGLQRMVEALESHLWPTMNPKQKGSSKPQNTSNAQPLVIPTEKIITGTVSERIEKKTPTEASPAFDEQLIIQAFMAGLRKENPDEQAKDQGLKARSDDDDGDMLSEHDIDDLDVIVNQLKGIREKSQTSDDETRRKMAASVASAFSKALGFDFDDDFADEDDEE